MAASRASIRYAKAVLSLAVENKVAETVAADMKVISNTIADNAELALMLQSPVIRSADKQTVLNKVFGKTNKATKSLIDTLIINKRIALLDDVASKYTQLYDAMRDSQVARVTTAVPLTDALKTKVLDKVKELTGKSADLVNVVDTSIIGGFVLRVGDLEYNASVANKLNNLKREFSIN
jgi:F-type H+-transporting ATPase subunit delta